MEKQEHAGASGEATQRQVVNRQSMRRRVGIGLLIIAVVAVAIAAYGMVTRQQFISQDVLDRVAISVYVPGQLPSGYKASGDGGSFDGDILTYTLKNDTTGGTIIVTTQASPDNFDMTKMIGKGELKNTQTKVGDLYNMSTGSSSRYLLDTGSSLLFFTSSNKIDLVTMRSIADNLDKIK